MAQAERRQREHTRCDFVQIDSGNIADLSIASTEPLSGRGPFGFFAATPLIDEDGVAYLQDLASNVFAYDLDSGEKLWEITYDKPVIGPNGLAYEDGTVYGVTDKDVFAIDADSGEETWKKSVLTGEFGVAEGQNLGLTIQPAVQDGVLYLSEAAKAGGGNILALDATDGSELWRFDTTDEPEGDETPSGGAWNTPALDDEGNVYFGVGNGYYSHNTPQKFQNSAALHRQRAEAECGYGGTGLVLPGPPERLLGLGSPSVADPRRG